MCIPDTKYVDENLDCIDCDPECTVCNTDGTCKACKNAGYAIFDKTCIPCGPSTHWVNSLF